MLKIPATAFCALLAAGADVQAQQQDAQHYIETLRNGIGIIRYCQGNGHLTFAMASEAIAPMESTLGLLSQGRNATPEQVEAADAAEKNGAAGKVGPASTDISENAKQMNTTTAQLCQDMHAKIAASIVPDEDDYKRALVEVYENVRNKIGVTHYCGARGHIIPTRAEEVASALRNKLPPEQPPEATASGDAAEKEGTAGKFGRSPSQIDLVEMGPQAAAGMCEMLVSNFAEEAK